MKSSQEINELTVALNKVQATLEGARTGSKNPFFNSKYASLKDTWDACRKVLTDNGLSVTQGGKGEEYETVLLHTSGQWIAFSQTLYIQKKDMQGLGSAITYARRDGLMSVLGMSPLEDDDGNAAVHGGREAKKMNWLEKKKAEKRG